MAIVEAGRRNVAAASVESLRAGCLDFPSVVLPIVAPYLSSLEKSTPPRRLEIPLRGTVEILFVLSRRTP